MFQTLLHSLPVVDFAVCRAPRSQVRLGDVGTTCEDELARAVRRGLRAAGVERGVPVPPSTRATPSRGLPSFDLSNWNNS